MCPSTHRLLDNQNLNSISVSVSLQGVSAGIAYATAIDTYLSNPSAFGLAPPVPTRGRSSQGYRILHVCLHGVYPATDSILILFFYVSRFVGPRRRESLLASLEKKAEPTGRTIFGASGDDALVSCDLISALTDSDMDIIDSYAQRLTETIGGDAEEAYAIALDAFVRGTSIHSSILHNTQKMSNSILPNLPSPIHRG